MRSGIVIEPYDWEFGFERLYEVLMEDVWKVGYEKQAMFDFRPVFMNWLYNRATDLLYSAYSNGKPVGFFGGAARKVRLNGIERGAYLGALF